LKDTLIKKKARLRLLEEHLIKKNAFGVFLMDLPRVGWKSGPWKRIKSIFFFYLDTYT